MGYASREFTHQVSVGASAMHEIERFMRRVGEVGHGTDIHGAVSRQFRPGRHDRVIIITDAQGGSGFHATSLDRTVPADVPIYVFNLGGYRYGTTQTGVPNRHELGGLSDATFKQIPQLEAGITSGWPWELSE